MLGDFFFNLYFYHVRSMETQVLHTGYKGLSGKLLP
uniref:Uncharacterized protein n=1 Tax=Anguilla anguilla TaxID=7936 RepID=A0A0E9TSU2_ANGAN